MTKIVKRLLITFLCVIQLVFLWLPVELKTLYDTRLGFMRQILFMNETYPIHLIGWLFWLLMLSVVYVLIRLGIKRSKKWKISNWLCVGWLLVVLLTIIIAVLLTTMGAPLYFYNLFCWCIVLVLQIVMIRVTI